MNTAPLRVADNANGGEISAQLQMQTEPPLTDVLATAGVEPIVVIDKRELFRECLASCIAKTSGRKVFSSPNIESWLDSSEAVNSYLIIYCCSGEFSASGNPRNLARLAQLM